MVLHRRGMLLRHAVCRLLLKLLMLIGVSVPAAVLFVPLPRGADRAEYTLLIG